MANTWQQFKTAAANSNPYEDEEERKRREGAISADSSLSTWQKYKAYANGGEYVEPDKELKKQLKADAKAYGKYKDDDSWKGNAELYASSKPLFDEYMKEASEASKQAAQTPAISMADINPNRTFKPQADKHPAMIQSAVDARNNELMQNRLKELEVKKAGNNTAEKDYFNSLPKAAQDAANNYNKAQQTANLDLLEQSEKDLMKAVGNDEEAYTKALTAAGSIYNGERVNALNESETLEYMQLKINTLPANQRKAVDKIMRGQALYFEGAPAMERGKDPAIRQNYYKEYKTLLKEGYDDLLKSGMSKEEADEYNEIAKRFANYQSTQKYSEKFAVDNSQSVDNNILKTAGKVVKGLAYDAVSFIPAGISGIFTDDINDPAGLGSRDIYDRANKLNNAIEYANSQINQNVFGGHPVLQQAYGIGASMAESAMAKGANFIPFVGRYIGTSAFFGKGYDAQYKSARERGLNPEQARLEGIAAGVAEFVTEEIELGIFNKNIKMVGDKWNLENIFKMIKGVANQSASEGGEEMISNILTTVADAIIAPEGSSEFETDIKNIKQANPFISDKEAIKQAVWDKVKEVAMDGLAGAISGGGSMVIGGSIATGINASKTKALEKDVRNAFSGEGVNEEDAARYQKSPMQYYADYARDVTEEEKALKAQLQGYADKENTGKSLNIFERDSAADAIAKAQAGIVNGQLEYESEKEYIPEEYREKRTAISKDELREKMQTAALNGDLNSLMEAYKEGRNAKSTDVRNSVDEMLNESNILGLMEEQGFTQEEIEKAKLSSDEAYVKGLMGEEVEGLSDRNQSAYNAGKIKSLSLKEASKLNIPSDSSRKVYESGIKDDTNIYQYNQAWNNFFTAGSTGIEFDKAKQNGVNKLIVEKFGEDLVRSFYDAGDAYRQATERKQAQGALNKALGIKNRKGTFEDIRTNANDNTDYTVFKALAPHIGVDIVLADSKSYKFIEGENAHIEVGTGKIYINADATVAQGFHEALSEYTEFYNSEGYEEVRKALIDAAHSVLGADRYSDIIAAYRKSYKGAAEATGQNIRYEDIEMSKEFTNDLIVAMMSTEKGRDQLANTLANNMDVQEATTLVGRIKELFDKLISSIKSVFEKSNLQKHQQEMLEKGYKELESNVDLFFKAFEKARQNAMANTKAEAVAAKEAKVNDTTNAVGIEYDAATESAYPTQFSLNSWTESDYVKKKIESAHALAKALNVTEEEAIKYIDDINSIAKMIADDRTRLDYDADPNNSSVVSNAEYGASIDFSTICKKRLLYTGTLQAIQKQIGNRVITMNDYLDIRNAMLNDGLETTCGCCYVEGSRVKLGQFMEQFIKRYSKDNPAYIPTMYDVTMPDGIRQLRAQHPEVFEAREKFLNNRGVLHEGERNLFSSQGKPKDYTERTEYRGEILKMFEGKPDVVEKKNKKGGLRIQSFSDFEIVNLIDCMQVITDMSRCGLAGQAYTKVYNFADALGNTGLKINLSLMGAGVDANGDLILDEVNGMKKEDAIKLRNKYSKNVGTIIVCFTDEQIKAAMKSDYIDFIIPFHRSQWRKSQYEALGLPENTRDYTMHQNDRVKKANGRLKKADANHMPMEYWNFSKTGRENAEHYIQMCNDEGKAPKFPFLLGKYENGNYYLPEGSEYDGYFKLLIDFKMYDNDGVGAEQMPVQPNFSMDECRQMLKDYTGGHESFPVNQKIADEFAERIKARGKEFDTRYSFKLKELDQNGYDRVLSLTGKPISSEFKDVLKRLDLGENVSLEEIQNVPEVKLAYKEIEGRVETINIPGREKTWDAKIDLLIANNGFAQTDNIVYNGTVARNKRADIVLGLPAAGKSSVIVENLLIKSQAMLIDSDEAKQTIDEYDHGWGAGVVHAESKEINDRLLKRVLDADMNIVMPVVGSKATKVYIELIKLKGYKVYIHLNSVDPTTSMSRMLKRYIEDGRFIDPRIIAKKGTEPERIYNELKGEANGYSKYSNEVRFGEKAILIEQSENMGWDDNRGDLESSRGRGSEETRANDKNGERKEELADTPLDIASSFMNIAETYDFYNTYDEVGNETDRSNYINTLADDIAKGNTEYIINTLMDILDDDDYESVHDEAQRLLDQLTGNRYSFEIDEALDEVFGSSEESSATNILEEGVRALKGKSVDKNKVRGLAIKLRNEYGSSYDVSQFADSLEKAFAYMQTQEHVDYPTMLGVIRDIAKPVIDEIKEKRNQEDYDALVSAMKSVGAVRLTDTQMKEVMYAFDNYGQFKNSMMPIRISNNASQTLEQAWKEMSDMVPWILDRDTTEGAMPGVLYDALTTARQPRNIYREDAEQMANDLALRIIEEYVGGKPKQKANEALKEYRAKVKADYDKRLAQARREVKANLGRKKLEIGEDAKWQKLLSEREARERRAKDRDSYNEKLAQAKAEIKDKAKANLDRKRLELNENAKWQKLLSERDLKERQAEFLARNKKEKQQARERQEVRQQKKQIQQSFNKLMHWISTPSEKNHVPKTLITPVLSFMHTLDFTQPVITMKNGEFSTRVAQVDRGVDGTKIRWITLTGASKDEVLDKFDKYIGRSDASRSAQVWTTKMQQVQNMFLAAANGDQFTNDPSYNDFIQKLDSSLADAFGELLQRSNNQNIPVNELGSYDLRVINSVLKNMIAAINKGNKAYAINEDVVEMGKQTIEAARGAKDKNHNKVVAGILKTLRVDNLTPKVFMELLGDSGKKLYKELRQGLNTKIFDIKKASEFMKLITEGIDQKDIQKWTGATATVHEVELSEGVVNITDGQIMALYETLKRAGAAERTVNGIRVGQIQRKGVQANIKESDVIRLSDADKTKLFGMLTKEQIELADKMQKYLAIECSKDGNEVSNMLYGYEKFVDETYFPWKVDQKETNTDNASTNLAAINAIERSGFTKSLKEGANNTLIINDIFDIFTDHVADMASYHGFAAANKDVLRWLNYREGNGVNVKGAVNRITGSEAGTGYIVQLLKDLNQMEKSNYIDTLPSWLMGNYKAAAVGANLRVVAQQPTAYFRALNNIDAKYLLTVNPKTAIKNIERAKELSAIAWWKSQGYYETSIGKSVKEIVTGQASMSEKVKEKLMAPAGWADDFTWGFLYTAVEKEQRALLKGQNISEEEFRKAVNDRFDEIIDTTQVVDSTLHRSQIMRAQNPLNKIQTAFMAEPTKSYNMLLEAWMTKDKKAFARAAGSFLLSAIATSAAAAIVDGFRYDTDDDKWYEVWLEKFKENAIDNVNPLNLLPVVKDLTPLLMQVITGEKSYGSSNSRFDMEAVTSLANTLTEFRKVFTGESNKSAYGVVMMSLKPISQLTGIPVYNLTRDVAALYNAFCNDIKTTVSTDKDKKKSVYNSVEKERDEKEIEEKVTNSVENHVPISKIEDYLKSQYKDQYYEVAKSGTEEELAALSEKIANGYAVLGMSDEEIDQMLAEWTEDAVTYAALDKAIEEGLNIFAETVTIQRDKKDEAILKHIMDRYGSSVEYEREHQTESEWEENVNMALSALKGAYDYDSAKEELEQKAKEQAEKNEASEAKKALKQNLFDAVEQSNPSAQAEAIKAMLDAGMDARTIKDAVSDKYHKEWKEADNQYDKNQARKKWFEATKIVNSTAKVKNAQDLVKSWNKWEKDQK